MATIFSLSSFFGPFDGAAKRFGPRNAYLQSYISTIRLLCITLQVPVIFAGSIRENLAPFGGHSDAALWSALRRSHLAPGWYKLGTANYSAFSYELTLHCISLANCVDERRSLLSIRACAKACKGWVFSPLASPFQAPWR